MKEYRLEPDRSQDLEGQRATPEMVDLLLEGESTVFGPEGPSIIYLPGAASTELFDAFTRVVSPIPGDNSAFSSSDQWGGWADVLPYFIHIGAVLKLYAPDRYAEQMRLPRLIEGTPFTEFTVNGTGYNSVIHHDQAGPPGNVWSTLGVLRRGSYTGRWLVFPEYGVGIDMQDGDVVLLRGHERHGVTDMICGDGAERISVVGTV